MTQLELLFFDVILLKNCKVLIKQTVEPAICECGNVVKVRINFSLFKTSTVFVRTTCRLNQHLHQCKVFNNANVQISSVISLYLLC